MWSPVNGHLSPLTPTATEGPLNVQTGPQGTVQAMARRCRALRRVDRSGPLYHRIDVRQHPYLITSINVSQQYNKSNVIPEEEIALDLRITTDDIQAATILMLFAKRLLVYKEQTRSEDKRVTKNARDGWLQTLSRQPRQRLLRFLHNLSDRRFALPRGRKLWGSEAEALLASCLAVRGCEPSSPVPRWLRLSVHLAEWLEAHARLHKMPAERDVCCPDCGMLPAVPVTGSCGHTRCLKCASNNAVCPCGVPNPQELHVDTCVQHLIGKLLAKDQHTRGRKTCSDKVKYKNPATQMRLLHALELLAGQRYVEAAAHLARAASCLDSELARHLLVQTLTVVIEEQEPALVARAVGAQAADAALAAADLECALCRDTLVAPVATPCGHTYCRRCIELAMDYRRACPLCLRDLTHFNLSLTRKSKFVCAALASVNMLRSPPPLDPSSVLVFVCVTAFPMISCPLLITLPRYRVLVRRILESGSRRLGMVTLNGDHSHSNYGTMLEVRDCIECDDGRMYLSTIGVSRFKIVERFEDSCFARVEPVVDAPPSSAATERELRRLGREMAAEALLWLRGLGAAVRDNIEQSFGRLPPFADTDWWRTPDGPDWLWWLVASLPLAPELKDMMISNRSLLTRMRMTRRSLLKLAVSSASEALLR